MHYPKKKTFALIFVLHSYTKDHLLEEKRIDASQDKNPFDIIQGREHVFDPDKKHEYTWNHEDKGADDMDVPGKADKCSAPQKRPEYHQQSAYRTKHEGSGAEPVYEYRKAAEKLDLRAVVAEHFRPDRNIVQ